MTRRPHTFIRFRLYDGERELSKRHGKWHVQRFSFDSQTYATVCGLDIYKHREGTEFATQTTDPQPEGSGVCRMCLWALRGQGE